MSEWESLSSEMQVFELARIAAAVATHTGVEHPRGCGCRSCLAVEPGGSDGGHWDADRGQIVWCRYCGKALDVHKLVGEDKPRCPVGA